MDKSNLSTWLLVNIHELKFADQQPLYTRFVNYIHVYSLLCILCRLVDNAAQEFPRLPVTFQEALLWRWDERTRALSLWDKQETNCHNTRLLAARSRIARLFSDSFICAYTCTCMHYSVYVFSLHAYNASGIFGVECPYQWVVLIAGVVMYTNRVLGEPNVSCSPF